MPQPTPPGGGGSNTGLASLPISKATRAVLWMRLVANNKASDVWQTVLNQIPQNYIKPFGSYAEYLAQASWESSSDARVYATDQALVATYNNTVVRGQPLSKSPQKPPGGTAPGQGGDIGGANPGLGLPNPLTWLVNNLVRLGEIAVGALIVGVGVNAMLRGNNR